MPAESAPMRKVREVLRLRHALGVSERQIAVTIGVSRSTVGEYLRRAAVIGITWPVPEGLDDVELERRLFTPPTLDETPTAAARLAPRPQGAETARRDAAVAVGGVPGRAHRRLRLQPICDLHRDWRKTISPTMRQTHGLPKVNLSTSLAAPCRSSMPRRERNGVLMSSSRCWEKNTYARRAGRKGLPTGSGESPADCCGGTKHRRSCDARRDLL